MSVSDIDLIHAWKQVLTLSRLEAGQIVTVLTGADTHPQTLRCAIVAATDMGARVNRLDLPPSTPTSPSAATPWPIWALRR